jgi:hypothetical protein
MYRLEKRMLGRVFGPRVRKRKKARENPDKKIND